MVLDVLGELGKHDELVALVAADLGVYAALENGRPMADSVVARRLHGHLASVADGFRVSLERVEAELETRKARERKLVQERRDAVALYHAVHEEKRMLATALERAETRIGSLTSRETALENSLEEAETRLYELRDRPKDVEELQAVLDNVRERLIDVQNVLEEQIELSRRLTMEKQELIAKLDVPRADAYTQTLQDLDD